MFIHTNNCYSQSHLENPFWLREAINEQIRDGSRECEKVYGLAINKTFILHSLDLKEHREIDI